MSVISIMSPVQYAGNGVTTVFAFPYKFLAATDIVVVSTNLALLDTIKVQPAEYSVTGAGLTAGGSITFGTAPAVNTVITIFRDTAKEQPVDYVAQDNFPAETHETALDRVTLQNQDLTAIVARSLRFPRTTSVRPQITLAQCKGHLLGFDDAGAMDFSIDLEAVRTIVLANPTGMFTNVQLSDLGTIAAGQVLKHRRGTFAQNAAFTGQNGEIVNDTDRKTLVLHDGATAGGFPMRRAMSVDVRDYGAKGDGVTDDSTAFAAAAAAALTLSPTYDTAWSVPAGQPSICIHIPKGKYLLNTKVTFPQRTIIRGENAIILGGAGITVFEATGFGGLIVDGLHFAGGAKAIYVNNGNASACWVHITNCYFDRQTTAAIDTGTNAFSTTLRIDHCYFDVSNSIALRAYCDQTILSDSWVDVFDTVGGLISAIYNYGGMVLDKVFLTPSGATVNATVPYCYNDAVAGDFKAEYCRFGGEGGGKHTLHSYSPKATSGSDHTVMITKCHMWGVATSHIRLYDLTDILIIRENDYAGEGFTKVEMMAGYAVSASFRCDCDDRVHFYPGADVGALEPMRSTLEQGADHFCYDNVLGAAASRHFSGFTDSLNLGTAGSATYVFDDSASNPSFDDTLKVITGTANGTGQPIRVQLLRSPTALPAGMYTWGLWVKSDKAFDAIMNCGYCQRTVRVNPSSDWGMVWMHGYNDLSRTTVQFNGLYLPLNATIFLARPFLYAGVMHQPPGLDMYALTGMKRHMNGQIGAPSAPASGGGSVVTKGTMIWNTTIGLGREMGWIAVATSVTPSFQPFGQQGYRTFAAAPAVDSYFIGEEALDTVAGVWYKSKGVGGGAADWVALN